MGTSPPTSSPKGEVEPGAKPEYQPALKLSTVLRLWVLVKGQHPNHFTHADSPAFVDVTFHANSYVLAVKIPESRINNKHIS
jgi:hypothetical protein